MFRSATSLAEFAPILGATKVYIYTDCQSVADSLFSHETKSNLVVKTVNALNSAADSGLIITISWVKAHVGIEGNERATNLSTRPGKTHL